MPKFSIVFLLILHLSIQSIAQSFNQNLQRFQEENSFEKIHFHFDKSMYFSGDSIWFKAYLLEGNLPAELSKSLYLNWYNDNGSLIQTTAVPIIEGTALGQFSIPNDYRYAHLYLKAYTKWMLNFDSVFQFEKTFSIICDSMSANHQSEKTLTHLEFFAEGGNLVAGLPNKIAFKANDQWGNPVKLKGVINNKVGDTLCELNEVHDGMGYFFLKPQYGEAYSVAWKDEWGNEGISQLPEALKSGITLQLGIAGKSRNFNINGAPTSSDKNNFTVIGTMYNTEVFKIQKSMNGGVIRGTIPTENLPSGLLTITVFDFQMIPLVERITFINNEDYTFSASLNILQKGIGNRQKNEIEITIPDSLFANLSISITDDHVPFDSMQNITSNLLLSSELRGKIYNAAYYFQNNSDSIARNLDLVMLTHGWRKIKWEAITQNKWSSKLFPRDSSYFTIAGNLKGVDPSRVKNENKIVLMFKQDGENKVYTLPFENDGSFKDPSIILFDTAQIFYQLPQFAGGKAKLEFYPNQFPIAANTLPSLPSIKNSSTNVPNFLMKQWHEGVAEKDLIKPKILDEVVIQKKKSRVEELEERYVNSYFAGGYALQFDLTDGPLPNPHQDALTYLRSRVPGLSIAYNLGEPVGAFRREGRVSLYLNEVSVDAAMLKTFPLSDIAYIKVFNPPFVASGNGEKGGAISIYLRKGADINYTSKGLPTNTLAGYSLVREFYNPEYEAPKNIESPTDRRTTLYWNPEILFQPGTNTAKIIFYNNDVSNGFKVVVEGMTNQGKLLQMFQSIK